VVGVHSLRFHVREPKRLPIVVGFKRYLLFFDGNDYVRVPYFPPPSEFTLEVLFKIASLDVLPQGFIGQAADIWSDTAYAFRVAADGRISFVTSADGSTVNDLRGSVVPEGRWCHAVATFKRPSKKIYINGEVDAVGTWDHDVHASTSDIIVGGYAFGTGLDYLLRGGIALVRVYNRELSQADVRYNMVNYTSPVRSGLLMWLHDRIVGDTWHDESPYHNDGTICGAMRKELAMWEIRAELGL